MSGTFVKIFWLWVLSAQICSFAGAQGRFGAASDADGAQDVQTVETALHQMSNRAAVIFIGTVADIHHIEANGLAAGVMEIRFQVEQPVRGCSAGEYVLREWGGFWNANDSRYRVGQRLLLLLHAPGASGLSSPVEGMEGAIPLRASGNGVRPSDRDTASAADQVADLRWIGARVRRTVNYRESVPQTVARARAAVSSATSAEGTSATGSLSDSSVGAQETSLANVVGMLHSWEVASHATR